MNLQHAARLLRGDVIGRNNVRCPGPGHSARDRSLSVFFFPDGGFWVESFAYDSPQTCRNHVSARLNIPHRKHTERLGRPSPARSTPAASDGTSRALALWRETKPLNGSPAEIYLKRRGVPYTGDALRWHDRCPFGRDRVGCMVALVRNVVTDEPLGVHRTAISPTGEKLSALGSNGRLSLGPIGGGVAKLTDNADVTTILAVGEGIETTLSVRNFPGLEQMPTWACLMAGNLAEFPVQRGLEAVWIVADNDASGTGQRAANTLARRLDAAGIEPVIILPRKVGTDINDTTKRAVHAA